MPHFNTSDGLSLYFEDDGMGVPILCLAGLTRNCRDFDFVLPTLLNAGARIIRLDYRGRGQSDWAPDFSSYTIQREGQDALELLAHLGLSKVAVLGTSRGGMIAMGLAATMRSALLGVALNDIGPEIDPRGLEVIMTYLGLKPHAKTYDEAADARAHMMRDLFPGVPRERWLQEVTGAFLQSADGLELSYDPKLRDAVEAMGRVALPDLWPFYEAIGDLPLAVIRGANSDLLTADCFQEMGRRLPHAICAEVPDRAHVPFLDEAEAVSALTQWIGELA